MVWNDKNYSAEILNPDQSKHEADKVDFNTDLFNWYKKFIGLHNQYEAIRIGNYTTIETNDTEKTYAFSRKLGTQEVIVIINRSDKNVHFTNLILKKGKFRDVFTKKAMKNLVIKPMDIVVLSNVIY
jgi:glycosidase